MTSSPRGRNVATAVAVVLTLVLALAWLRSSGGGTLDVPAGLSVGTVPAVVPEEPAEPDGGVPPAMGIERERAGGGRAPARKRVRAAVRKPERRRADRAGGREDARAPVEDRGARLGGRVPIRQDPPATAPAPQVRRGAVGGRTAGGAPSAPPPPEFALE